MNYLIIRKNKRAKCFLSLLRLRLALGLDADMALISCILCQWKFVPRMVRQPCVYEREREITFFFTRLFCLCMLDPWPHIFHGEQIPLKTAAVAHHGVILSFFSLCCASISVFFLSMSFYCTCNYGI